MAADDLGGLASLFAELNNLKRIRTAASESSLAEQLFRSAWARLAHGERKVEFSTAASALARILLGGIDATVLRSAGLNAEEAALLEERSFDAAAKSLDPALRSKLRAHLTPPACAAAAPAFVNLLCAQPRAGATRSGHARLVVVPQESHAEHCLLVAVYAVLTAPRFDADPAVPFLAALSHHFHNAALPDSGFAGEELLGEFLPHVVQTLTRQAASQLDAPLPAAVFHALAETATAASPEGKAFHAADVLDRVLQMKWYEDAARFTLSSALKEMELVHAGPLRDFQMSTLREAGLC